MPGEAGGGGTGAGDPGAEPRGGRRFDLLFPILLAAAYAALQLGLSLALYPIGDIGVETDFYGELGEAARRLCAGHFSVLNHPYKGPLTSVLVCALHGLVRPLGGDWYRAGVLLNVLAAALALALTYRLVLAAYGRRVAVAATVFTSLVYELFGQAHKASSDVLFLLLFTATAWLVVRGVGHDLVAGAAPGARAGLPAGGAPHLRPGRLAVAGVTAGLAYLTRYNGLVLPLAAVPAVLLAAPRGVPARRRLGGAAALLLAFAVTVAPWFALNLAETGRPLATGNLQNIFVEEFRGEAVAPGLEAPDRPTTLLGVLAEDPARAAGRYLENLGVHFWRDMWITLPDWSIVLVGLGLLRLLVVPPRRRQTAFLLFPLVYFLAMAAVYHQPRFSLPLLAGYWSLAWAAVLLPWRPRSRAGERLLGPVAALARRSGPLRRLAARPAVRRGAATALLLAVAVVMVHDLVTAERFYLLRRPLEVLPAARFLRARAAAEGLAGDGAGVMARKPHLAFYAGLPYVPYPGTLTTRAALLDSARARGARWLAYGNVERLHYPWQPWLADLAGAPGVATVYDEPGLRIYELAAAVPAGGPTDALARRLADRLRRAEAAGAADSVLASALSLGRRWSDLGEWEPAAAAYARGLAAAGTAADSCGMGVELAWALAHLGRWEEIRRRLEAGAGAAAAGEAGAATRGCPPALVPVVHDLLGRAYLNLGRPGPGAAELRRALAGYEAAGDEAAAATVRRALAGLR